MDNLDFITAILSDRFETTDLEVIAFVLNPF